VELAGAQITVHGGRRIITHVGAALCRGIGVRGLGRSGPDLGDALLGLLEREPAMGAPIPVTTGWRTAMSPAVGRLVRTDLKLMTRDPLVLTFAFAFPGRDTAGHRRRVQHHPGTRARRGELERAGKRLSGPPGQIIESVNDTFKGQLDLERHGGHIPDGVLPESCSASSRRPPSVTTTRRPACHAFNTVVVASKS
jgi:hypothetical protein